MFHASTKYIGVFAAASLLLLCTCAHCPSRLRRRRDIGISLGAFATSGSTQVQPLFYALTDYIGVFAATPPSFFTAPCAPRRRSDIGMSLASFATCVRCILHNAITYHTSAAALAPVPVVAVAAKRLLQHFDKALVQLARELAPPDAEAARLAALLPSSATLIVVPPPMVSWQVHKLILMFAARGVLRGSLCLLVVEHWLWHIFAAPLTQMARLAALLPSSATLINVLSPKACR